MRGLNMMLCLLGVTQCAQAEDTAMARLFKQAGVDGAMVIVSMNGGQRFVHNDLPLHKQIAMDALRATGISPAD